MVWVVRLPSFTWGAVKNGGTLLHSSSLGSWCDWGFQGRSQGTDPPWKVAPKPSWSSATMEKNHRFLNRSAGRSDLNHANIASAESQFAMEKHNGLIVMRATFHMFHCYVGFRKGIKGTGFLWNYYRKVAKPMTNHPQNCTMEGLNPSSNWRFTGFTTTINAQTHLPKGGPGNNGSENHWYGLIWALLIHTEPWLLQAGHIRFILPGRYLHLAWIYPVAPSNWFLSVAQVPVFHWISLAKSMGVLWFGPHFPPFLGILPHHKSLKSHHFPLVNARSSPAFRCLPIRGNFRGTIRNWWI